MAEGKIGEVQRYVDAWRYKTDQILLEMISRYELVDTQALRNSLRSRVYKLTAEKLGYDLTFLTHGRFREMAVGRGRGRSLDTKIESTSSNREIIKKSEIKPAKWFSRPFYGRLNALQGAIGVSMMETAIQSLKKPMEDVKKG